MFLQSNSTSSSDKLAGVQSDHDSFVNSFYFTFPQVGPSYISEPLIGCIIDLFDEYLSLSVFYN